MLIGDDGDKALSPSEAASYSSRPARASLGTCDATIVSAGSTNA